MNKHKKKLKSFEETYLSSRKEWTIKPITRIIPNKKKNFKYNLMEEY